MKKGLLSLIGNTPLIQVPSLSEISGCQILLKCENRNPGGSVKDRPALFMIEEAEKRGDLKPGMTIVEGTAGNTGIGLALVGAAKGYKVKIVMPKGQAAEKEQMLKLYGAEILLVDPVPFANENHFYHTAKRIGQEPGHWWGNQFENTDNMLAHFRTTGPEIYQQTHSDIDYLVSVSGSGGTIAGCSQYLKMMKPEVKVYLVDPQGSGLYSYFKTGEFKATGSSITEGIGIMRLVENFKQAKIDEALTYEDQLLVDLAHQVRLKDGLTLGISAALNLLGALHVAVKQGKGKTIVTFLCDGGERALSKLYNPEFLVSKGLTPGIYNLDQLARTLKNR